MRYIILLLCLSCVALYIMDTPTATTKQSNNTYKHYLITHSWKASSSSSSKGSSFISRLTMRSTIRSSSSSSSFIISSSSSLRSSIASSAVSSWVSSTLYQPNIYRPTYCYHNGLVVDCSNKMFDNCGYRRDRLCVVNG